MRERLERQLSGISPELREHIAKRITAKDLPPALADAVSKTVADTIARDAAPLESMVPEAALEAIIQITGRPPLLIANDEVQLEPLPDFAPDAGAKLVGLNPWIPSVGRVEFLNHRMQWGGTGWVVDRKGKDLLLVTNRHVAKLVAQRTASGAGSFMRSAAGPRFGMRIDFREEAFSADGDDSRTVPVTDIVYLADDLAADMAILRVVASPLEISPLDLSAREAARGEMVAIIGYPAFDSRNDADDQARYFRDLYEVKRMAPGFVQQPLSGATTLSHDCTSLGGNSGSPLIAVESRSVVGLHFSGVYGVANTAVGVTTIKQVLARTTTAVPVGMPSGGGGGEGAEGPDDGHHDADFFRGRQGFAKRFLADGVETPWPGLPARTRDNLAVPSDEPREPGELRYTHFGVKYSVVDKLPIMTAVNIDGAATIRIKRGKDRWFSDGRIAAEVQVGSENFHDAEIDRGHMVRREDPNWGDDTIARQANGDTFHYVNAAAQHSLLNQGKALWQGLENYILDNSRTHGFRACVFTGPVLADDDEVIDGARVPQEFWKLVATLDEQGKRLRATAYLLSQGQMIRDLMERRSRTEANEGVVLGEYRTFQIALSDLADATGYDFSDYLGADPLGPGVDEAANTVRFVPLARLSDVVL
jgi:endonuclease G